MPFKVLLSLLGLIASTAAFSDVPSGDDDAEGDDDKKPSTPPKDDKPADNGDDDILGTEGMAALKAEREARKLANAKISDLEKSLADVTKKLQDRDDAENEAQGQWQKLAESRAKRIEELETKIADAETAEKRKAILDKYKLTGDEAVNVHGETIEDYEKSAKLQAKLLGRDKSPDPHGGDTDPNPAPKGQKESKLSNWKFN